MIELMIVVAIVGVLAALAIYGVRKYLLSAKTVEARNAVGQMAKDAKAAFDRDTMSGAILIGGGSIATGNQLCTDASNSVPKTQASIAGRKYQSTEAEWIVDRATPGKGFACLRFAVTDPQYYMYSYTGSVGATGAFSAVAQGDLDGNGTLSSFTMNGKVVGTTVFVSPNIMEVTPEE